MRINSNIAALNAWRNMAATDSAMSKSLERLSSGFRINRAADDAAGLAISEKMRGQVRGLNQAVRNAQDSISLIQTAEGALNESHRILQRMRELAAQAASDTNTDADRSQLQKEFDQLIAELDRISATTEFNTKKLLDGSISEARVATNGSATIVKDLDGAVTGFTIADPAAVTSTDAFQLKILEGTNAGTVKIQVTSALGAAVAGVDNINNTLAGTTNLALGNGVVVNLDNTKLQINDEFIVRTTAYDPGTAADRALSFQIGANFGQNISVGIGNMSASALGLKSGGTNVKIDGQFKASAAVTFVDTAMQKVSDERSKLGAIQNRLEHTIANLSVASENLAAAESRIRDVDMAQEMMSFTRSQILLQAGTAMMAQANQRPQAILQLLR
ncbi:MAG: flagellin [Bacillota bacterium]